MYYNIFTKRTKQGAEVHLWDDKAGYQKFNYKNHAYIKSPSGTYTSLYGDKLKKVTYWEQEDIQKGNIFESDVPLDTKILIEKYGDSDEVSEGHSKMYFDIEVEVTDGFPDPKRAENKITSIALYDKTTEEYLCLILGNVKGYTKDDVTIESFSSEEELLQRFYQKYLEISPHIISGWNVDGFDIPYLYNRTTRILGSEIANCISPIGDVFYSENRNKYKIGGVSVLDYLALYKKFTYTQQSSYRLDYIGQLEVDMGKIEYEGTLNDLYTTDINKFIEYNLMDVKIIDKLDEKLQLIDLVISIAHLGHVNYEDVQYSSRYLEGALLTYLKRIGVIAPNKNIQGRRMMDNNEKFTGAYVKEPISGQYDWVYDLDLTSMYPSIIMSLNISPETKIGKLLGWDVDEHIKGVKKTYSLESKGKIKGTFNEKELASMLKSNDITIATNGVLYKNDRPGLMSSILSKWFDERVEYKRLMKKFSDAGDKDKAGYFKRRQHVQKIMLNSLYGALGLPVFRFFDRDNAEATTVTGQRLIKFTEQITNKYYNNKLGDDKDYCIYTDTDSVFYSAIPLVKKEYPEADLTDDKFMTEQILRIAKEVQDFINKGYDLFATRFLNIKTEHRFDIKQECIAKSGLWITKKRYGQWIINDGGFECDRLDVKGLDIVRSSFPPAMRDLMSKVLKDILHKTDKSKIDKLILDFKKLMKQVDIEHIALPIGVKNLTKFIDKHSKTNTIFSSVYKGTPVHVKAAIMYNDLMKYFEVDGQYSKIANGEKIKWVYLKENPLNVPQVAFKGHEDPPEVLDFIKQYIDYDKLFERALQKKLRMFYDSLDWSEPVDSSNTLERFF